MEDQNVYKKDANNAKNYRIKGFSQNLDEVNLLQRGSLCAYLRLRLIFLFLTVPQLIIAYKEILL